MDASVACRFVILPVVVWLQTSTQQALPNENTSRSYHYHSIFQSC